MLRRCDAGDAPLLAELNLRLIEDEGHSNRASRAALEERMGRWLDGGGYQAVVLMLDTEVAGYALFRDTGRGIHLHHFYVERGFRRRGLGRAALAALRRDVWPEDTRVTVDVLVANRGGHAFWRSAGFDDYAVTLETR